MTEFDERRAPEPAASVFLHAEEAPPADAAPGPESGSASPAPALPVEGTGPQVHLDAFEGPLDLLLYLIKEEQMDITNIPIARITDQYLATLGDLERLDLDRAGEYLVMAAELMRIKARMLIPRESDEDEEDAYDPRADLARRLLEYREFKRVAEDLARREEEWRGIFHRAAAVWDPPADGDDELGVSLLDLMRAFKGILDAQSKELPISLEAPTYSVDDQIRSIRAELDRFEEGVPFERIFEGRRSRPLLIATFLALLELVRQREIVARQVDTFGEIWLQRAREDVSADA